MIVVQLLGGLGNQMFQYAAARRLAVEKATDLILDISAFDSYGLRTYKLGHFNIAGKIATQSDRSRFLVIGRITSLKHGVKEKVLPGYRRRLYSERQEYHFEPDILETPNEVYLRGYFQNEGYFKSIEPIIRRDFTLNTPVREASLMIAGHIRAVNAVSLHIRRGDYANDPNTLAYHGLLPLEYYQDAVERITAKVDQPHFFIFSDDPEWARTHLSLPYPFTLVDHNDSAHDYEDLYLLSLCQHHIIANSSFSWWGAWLSEEANKIVYAPKNWLKGGQFDTTQVTLSTWIRL